MNTDLQTLFTIISRPESEPLSARETCSLEAMHERYPYFPLPAALLITRQEQPLPDETMASLVPSLMLTAPAKSAIRLSLDKDRDRWINFYPTPVINQKNTTETIDTFLQKYGKSSPQETILLEQLIFNPTPEYAQILEQETPEPLPSSAGADPTLDSINSFLNSHPASSAPRHSPITASASASESEPLIGAGTSPEDHPEPPLQPRKKEHPAERKPQIHPETPLGESLARIYIKQRKYQKAYDLILSLQRKHPNASPFYADQLRFLSKVIAATARPAKP